ncbi:histidine--tRNA ligase [Paenibacillus mesophilus]|uniref:histidine--tRNA ligase n=1 Tax=Paenibacillus mesophilus TaxID=2582849 RepID=UPI00110E782E|nr:histidine--tRNA ligase [Paenibacillus mesophilus]TMV45391.1 histidine--tRNA ligase [Paenibacillus mesophilus]
MQNVKGTFDFRAGEQKLRNRIRAALERQFALYDFEPLETPILNEQSLLGSKYAGGEEIMREMYHLTDQGGRSLGLRYDLTVPFAKVVAMNPGLELPYKRYEIGKVFRDGPVKRGRLREFTQCDADVAGTEGPEAEVELIGLAADVFRELGIDIVIRWNNRRFLGDVLCGLGISGESALSVMLTLDKLDKIGVDGVLSELGDKLPDPEAAAGIARLIREDVSGFEALVERFALAGTTGTTEVRKLLTLLRDTGLAGICRFDPFLSRGLSFYTGTVYEIFAADGSYKSSLGSGGRYDAIIGKLVGREDVRYPAVGISFGLDSIMELLRAGDPGFDAPAVCFVPIGDTIAETLRSASMFRTAGIRARVESGSRKLKRTLAAAAAKGVRFIVMIGADEAAAGFVRLKDMATGEETVGPAELALWIVERAKCR